MISVHVYEVLRGIARGHDGCYRLSRKEMKQLAAELVELEDTRRRDDALVERAVMEAIEAFIDIEEEDDGSSD